MVGMEKSGEPKTQNGGTDDEDEMDEADEDIMDAENDDEEGGSSQKQYQMGGGRIRRTKDTQGSRDHKCSFCSKTYLSYPALYTHLRNKHAKGADGSAGAHGGGAQGSGSN